MKLNLKWLWITWKQTNTGQDFSSWVIQNHRVNEQNYIRSRKPDVGEYHLSKDIKNELNKATFKTDNEKYLREEKFNEVYWQWDM